MAALVKGQRSKLAKKAEALSRNLSALVERYGVERVVMTTLTFRENLRSFRKAQQRYNSINVHVLRHLFVEHVCAVHRQKRGAIHYHLIAVTRDDVRSGFDFDTWAKLRAHVELFGRDNAKAEVLAKVVFRSANPALRGLWSAFRECGPRYGFGRIETYPVRSNADAIGRYVGSYVRVGAENRQIRDKGMRTIRYSLLPGHRVASVRFSWVDGAGRQWREGCRLWGLITGVDEHGLESFAAEWGSRWARHLRDEIGTLGRWSDKLATGNFYEQVERFTDLPRTERVKAAMALVRHLKEKEAKDGANE